MELGLTGGVALITGGGGGIGRATAFALAAEGVKVAVLDLDATLAKATAEQIAAGGGDAIAIPTDVTEEISVKNAVESIVDTWGGVDYLILCAGISGLYGKTIEEIEVSEWDQLFAVNVKGQWLPCKFALPHLRNSNRASISIVASDSALVGSPLHVPYCSSKGAVLMFTKALSVDLREDGIRVNCVCPSIVDTPMPRADLGLAENWSSTVDYPVHRPEDIARYLTLLAAPATAGINGHPLVADFGYLAQSGFPA
jgi:NAD(P)-dependent dehydrogenase (short-subunit alcohol dehydrogenase family)